MHMYTYLEVEGVAVVRVKLIKEMVEERRAGYAAFATVSTDGRSVEDIVAEILSRRRKNVGAALPRIAIGVGVIAALAWIVIRQARHLRAT